MSRLAHDRVRASTMAAEDVLHDLGVIPITSSDAQGMGRAGETVRRTFAMASVMKAARGPLAGDGPDDDNARVLRYLAKLTINPALAHGIAHEVGSLEPGKLADIVLWRPEMFGAKPFLVLKAGLPAWGVVGDPNASLDSCEPLVLGPQFGGSGAAPADLSVVFVNAAAAAADSDIIATRRRRVAVHGTQGHRARPRCSAGTTGSVPSRSARTPAGSRSTGRSSRHRPWSPSRCRGSTSCEPVRPARSWSAGG